MGGHTTIPILFRAVVCQTPTSCALSRAHGPFLWLDDLCSTSLPFHPIGWVLSQAPPTRRLHGYDFCNCFLHPSRTHRRRTPAAGSHKSSPSTKRRSHNSKAMCPIQGMRPRPPRILINHAPSSSSTFTPFSTHRSLVTSCCQRPALHKAPHTDRVACHVNCQRPALHSRASHRARCPLDRLAAMTLRDL